MENQDNHQHNPLLEMLLDIHEKVSETNANVAVVKALQEEDIKRLAILEAKHEVLSKQAGLIKGALLFVSFLATCVGIVAAVSRI